MEFKGQPQQKMTGMKPGMSMAMNKNRPQKKNMPERAMKMDKDQYRGAIERQLKTMENRPF